MLNCKISCRHFILLSKLCIWVVILMLEFLTLWYQYLPRVYTSVCLWPDYVSAITTTQSTDVMWQASWLTRFQRMSVPSCDCVISPYLFNGTIFFNWRHELKFWKWHFACFIYNFSYSTFWEYLHSFDMKPRCCNMQNVVWHCMALISRNYPENKIVLVAP